MHDGKLAHEFPWQLKDDYKKIYENKFLWEEQNNAQIQWKDMNLHSL